MRRQLYADNLARVGRFSPSITWVLRTILWSSGLVAKLAIPVRVSIGVIKYRDPKASLGRKCLFQLTTLWSHSITEGSQGGNLR